MLCYTVGSATFSFQAPSPNTLKRSSRKTSEWSGKFTNNAPIEQIVLNPKSTNTDVNLDNDSLTKNNDIEDEHYSTMNEDNFSQLESVLKTTSLASKL